MSPQNQASGSPRRPREVTLGGMQAVAGSVMALVMLISAAQQLNGSQMTQTLTDLVNKEQVAALNLTVENARTLLRYVIMAFSVLSVTSLVLGIYVLRRHRASRVGLTVVGAVVGGFGLLAGPVGWVATAYIGVSIFLIWSRPARAWFSDGSTAGGGPGNLPGGPSGGGDGGPGGPGGRGPSYGPPQGPRRDVGGVLPPASTGSGPDTGSGHDDPPPPTPPPPPPPRR